jgi:predicted PurR-regulated permease PerM
MSLDKSDSRDVTTTTLAVFFIGMLIAASFWILRPFLTAVVWATMIVVATWPVLLWLQARLRGSRGWAVTVMTVLILMVVIVPFLLAMVTIIERAPDIALRIKALVALGSQPLPEWVQRIPLVGQKINASWQQLAVLNQEQIAAHLTPYASQAVGWFVAQAGSLAMMVLQFLVVVLIAAILYAKGESVAGGVSQFARRLAGAHEWRLRRLRQRRSGAWRSGLS